ncbi:hypothetical protein HAX54_025052, partial [Datura stramonium]|nr:hypothetical protein [Datura stramonium]
MAVPAFTPSFCHGGTLTTTTVSLQQKSHCCNGPSDSLICKEGKAYMMVEKGGGQSMGTRRNRTIAGVDRRPNLDVERSSQAEAEKKAYDYVGV